MLRLTEVKSILQEYNIHPSKRLGQNFLIDQNIKDKIIGHIQLSKECIVLEIGPGLGAITEELCKKTKKVIAIEKDKRLYDFLLNSATHQRRALVCGANLELINDDILKYGFKDISSKLIVIGNLPYSISSLILNKLIDNRNHINSIYITVQIEFGERLVALPGAKDYGSLSCYAQFYGEPKILFKIPRGAFFPVPEVDSCFLRMDMLKGFVGTGQCPVPTDQILLFKIIRSSFEKRRKTILNSLYASGIFSSKEHVLKTLKQACICPERRPETISLQEFIKLSTTLDNLAIS